MPIHLPSTLMDGDFGEGGAWQTRDLVERDFDEVCELCRNAFPLNYPENWYRQVVTGCFISFGLFHNDLLTSLIVAEQKRVFACDPEDKTLCKDPNATVIYILSLAVNENYRRHGIATLLLGQLIRRTCRNAQAMPKLLFLHVLCDNFQAIAFYRRNGFQHHATLPHYYLIDEQYRDGCTFVRYIYGSALSELLDSVYTFCGSLLQVVASPFRRCFNHFRQSYNDERYRRQNFEKLFRM